MNWTPEQEQAIYKKDSNILVAAAAGSGKTAVLVERIINKIIKENDIIAIENLDVKSMYQVLKNSKTLKKHTN